uniref:Jacalin-type lectin domain-containing protein n=1 Tax=Solanum lycopersicum TaxID=4081 RepID=A0A3Q7J2I3_SOLLC|nr:inactive protein RESTRICTED TEV MOVEMENT 1-like [Solanum lycopersicum]
MIKVGPVGSNVGSIWEENGRSEVAGIFVSFTENTIQSLQFLFYENGNYVQSNKHGSDHSENFCALLFDYPSEFLTSISGSYIGDGYLSTGLDAIKFNTNKGCYGPFGRTEPTSSSKRFNFELRNHRLFGGFHGTMSRHAVESIGIYVKPVISSMNYLKGSLRVKAEK